MIEGIRLRSAAYDPATGTVTLTPKGRLAPNQELQLTVRAAGLLDAAGRSIDGDGDGQPGGDSVIVLGRPKPRPRGAARPAPVGAASEGLRPR